MTNTAICAKKDKGTCRGKGNIPGERKHTGGKGTYRGKGNIPGEREDTCDHSLSRISRRVTKTCHELSWNVKVIIKKEEKKVVLLLLCTLMDGRFICRTQ